MVCGLAAAAVVAIAFAIVSIRPRLAGNATTVSAVLTSLSNGRTVIWLTGLRGWLAHQITGWGPDGFMGALERAVGADWYATLSSGGVGLGSADNAHSFLVQALVALAYPALR